MPVMQTHSAACKRCHWKAVWRGSDVVLLPACHCPACGGDLEPANLSAADYLNPIYRLNYLRLLASAVSRG